MSPQPSRSKTHLTQPFSLCLLTMAVLTLLPGMRGAGAIAPSPNPPRSLVGLPQQIAQTPDAAKKAEADRLLQQWTTGKQYDLLNKLQGEQADDMRQSVLSQQFQNLQQFQQQLEQWRQNNITKMSQKFETGIATLQRTLEIYRQLKDRKGEAEALVSLGSAYWLLATEVNQYRNMPFVQAYLSKAIDYQHQSLAIARELKDQSGIEEALSGLYYSYRDLARFSYALKDYPKVIDSLQKRLAIIREQKGQEKEEAQILNNLGDVYREIGDISKAIDSQRESLAIAHQMQDILGLERAFSGLGFALESAGKFPEAENSLLEAITSWESLRRREPTSEYRNLHGSLYDRKAWDDSLVEQLEREYATYRSLQRVLVAQNKFDAALEIAERGRARAFVALLLSRIQGERDSSTVIPPISLSEIKQVANAQNATLVQYSIIDENKNASYEGNYKYSIIDENNKVAVGMLQEERQVVDASALYIWVVQPTGAITFRKVDLSPFKQQNTTLAELVFNSRDAIGVRGLSVIGVVPTPGTQQKPEANPTEQLQQLHKLLIAPIADLLPTDPNTHVIFLPQGSLFLAPFAALQDPQGKYLIEQHTILVSPSIQVLELTHQQRQQVQKAGRQQVLVVGNPKMPLQLPQLPGTQQEAEAIAALLHTQAIIGVQATKAAIVQQMPNARLIHLATHGIFDDQQGLASAIALAPNGTGEKTDGLLTADEILNLKLNAELVVLSACDTGRGRITGDGVIGLSRSLITAGVPSVLVSLWAVPDAPTASLMQGFYQQLQSNPDKAQALRQTMLSTMKQHPNPRDWAAFVLIGEAQ